MGGGQLPTVKNRKWTFPGGELFEFEWLGQFAGFSTNLYAEEYHSRGLMGLAGGPDRSRGQFFLTVTRRVCHGRDLNFQHSGYSCSDIIRSPLFCRLLKLPLYRLIAQFHCWQSFWNNFFIYKILFLNVINILAIYFEKLLSFENRTRQKCLCWFKIARVGNTEIDPSWRVL